MSDKTSESSQNNISRDVLLSFEEQERDQINELWIAGEVAGRTEELISQAETEQALEDLHIRLDFRDRPARILGYIQNYGRYVAAAVAIIVIGTAFLLIPQSVEAPLGEMAVVTLSDGSTVELNSGASIQFNRLFGITNRNISLNGEAYFDVESSDTPFRITANGTVTEVLGTKFNIRSWPNHPQNETHVAVEEGTVKFYPKQQDRNAVILQEEMESRWQAGLEVPENPSAAELDRVTGWRERKFIFYDESLQQIFNEVERRFNLHIELENRDVADETLTGYYGKVSGPQSLLDDICTVAGLNYSKTANGYRVY
ncbi:FecR family protein [Rhodohalobacter sp. 8-1]|uniref:FecR family protein n=1 Tax=Rhodohalobacter sp. 8-1 TaxID=3131972 RepID=UPI0030EF525B